MFFRKLINFKSIYLPALWTASRESQHVRTISLQNSNRQRKTTICLPQYDPLQDERTSELEKMQTEYQFEVNISGQPAQIKTLPTDEQLPLELHAIIKKTIIAYNDEGKRIMNVWNDEDDVKAVYTPIFGKPQGADKINDDLAFGRQRLASLNSSLISLCTEIPEKFGVTEELIKPFLEGMTMRKAMEENKLFIIDLKILEGCPAKTEKYVITCPFALFFFNNDHHLKPIAIQLFQQKGPDNPVFLPSDPPYTWLLAKLWYNLADATYHQALTHLNFTHFMMEGICVATHRQLSPSHPMFILLHPHFKYLMAVNEIGREILVSKGGDFDKTSNGGIKAVFHLIKKSKDFWSLEDYWTLPANLKRRGVFDQSVLTGAYHMRDDALLLYDAIKNYVQKYVTHYYEKESALQDDNEIQNWGAEIVMSVGDGGAGIKGVQNGGRFETTDQLVMTLTPILYTCSVGHAAANSQQYDEYGDPFNYPFIMHGVPPKDKGEVSIETILQSIATKEELLRLMAITKLLSAKDEQKLGDFEELGFTDPPAIQILEEFQQNLRDIGKTIDKRNKSREPAYDWLHPRSIPNSISI